MKNIFDNEILCIFLGTFIFILIIPLFFIYGITCTIVNLINYLSKYGNNIKIYFKSIL